jgi:hypothetical protein
MVRGGTVDETLIRLVDIVEDMSDEFSVGVVLVLPGGVLQGQIVGRRRWYKEWLSTFGQSGSNAFARFIDILNDTAGNLSEDGSILDHDGTFLHILEGRLIGPLSTNKMPWRVKAEHIAAWSLGAPGEAQ